MKKVAVVLPTYNERENIGWFVKQVLDQEKNLPGWSIEVVISDSASPDGTGEIAKKLAKINPKVHFIQVGRGLGVGIIKGHLYSIKHIDPDVLAQMDADGQVDVEVLPKLVETIDQGYDLAIGSRFVKGGKNLLSPTRRLFTYASSWVSRIIMGPFNIKEFTNSARAFTPELFKKINLDRLPWKEKTFIIQPAFLNEAVLAGAKYKEVPLTFQNRAEGYSKNKVVNYTYDVMTYAIDARLHKWGIDFPFFQYTRRAKTIIKFSVVGFTGTFIDFAIYNILIGYLHFRPATSKGISTEVAILNNFILNHSWTFRHRKTNSSLWQKLATFNIVSFGGLAIAVLIVKFLHMLYEDGFVNFLGLDISYYNLYFLATIPPVLLWNFTINHFITWKHNDN